MILCCGEALIDMVPDRTNHGDVCMVPKSGGAVFNTAMALGRLGADVQLFTGVSKDMFGRQLQGELTSSGVSTAAVVEIDAPSSLAFVELSDGNASYTFYTDGAADTLLTPEMCPTDLSAYQAVFFGGISLCTNPTASTLQALMRKAKQAGCLTMIDPNIRASFIADEAAYRKRIGEMMALADIIKMSDDDLAWVALAGSTLSDQIATLGLPESALVLITRGPDGATAFDGMGQQKLHVPSQAVTVADTIGAGDTFNAGVLFKLAGSNLASADLERAMAFGNACAAFTVSRIGANPPRLADVAS